MASTRFSSEALLDALPAQITPRRYWIAYSGGVDSMVLLHALAALQTHTADMQLCAIHVNHGLSKNAGQWAEQCARFCVQLSLPFTLCEVRAAAPAGESPEAAARDARYKAIAQHMQPGDCLLTAHHQDDQAETLLLQLLRGAGPKGLAAMPALSRFSSGWHARPLLDFRRDDLLAYAEAHKLVWQEDESNADTRFERNFLRHDILPRLKQHFPGMAGTLARSARRCAEAADILHTQALADLQAVQRDATSLSVCGLRKLGEVRARNLLHDWIHARALPLPSEAQLLSLWRDVVCAADDAVPLLRWPGVEVRRYRDALGITPPLAELDGAWQCKWDLSAPLDVPGLGRLLSDIVTGDGVACEKLLGSEISVRFRQGGERLCVPGRQGHHSLKKLFQEAGVAPWQRSRIPLLFVDDSLAVVVGHWIDSDFIARENQLGILLSLEPAASGMS